jgi:hypothetical protein
MAFLLPFQFLKDLVQLVEARAAEAPVPFEPYTPSVFAIVQGKDVIFLHSAFV